MNKSLLFTFAALSWLGASAAPLTPQEALQRLRATTRSAASADMSLAYTTYQEDGQASVYIFNSESSKGYAILSADDCGAPLLGYSDSGKFVESEMSPDMKWWISEYGRQMEYARKKGIPAYQELSTRASRAAIAPMIKTKWNQDAPYNNLTPTVDGKHCVTGCVATSMAQVMKYWNYPEIGKGSGSCTVVSGNKSTTEKMNFGEQKFDWANMLDVYNSSATQEQQDAVAYLMRCCGYAVNMTYRLNESAAAPIYAAEALISNFGYNKNIQFCEREYYAPADWDNMIYGELAAGRPMMYGGQSIQGGHSFVCDGYDGNGYYHFNWGWGGSSDGYFMLNALDPSSLGIGANGGGYNFGQTLVRGIQKDNGSFLGDSMILYGSTVGSIKGNLLTMNCADGVWNESGRSITVSLGAMIEPVDGTPGSIIYKEISGYTNYALQNGYGWSNRDFQVVLSTALDAGTYKVTLVYNTSDNTNWRPMLCAPLSYNYVMVNKSGTKFTVSKNKDLNLSVEDGSVVGDLLYGQPSTLRVKVNNPTDREITKSVYPILCVGTNPVFEAQGVTVNLEPGETVTKEFVCSFSLADGATAPTTDTEYTLRFYDPAVYNEDGSPAFYPDFSRKVTMTIGETPVLIATDFSMPGVKYTATSRGRKIYYPEDMTKVPVEVSLKNNGGVYQNTLAYVLYINTSGNQLEYVADYDSPLVEVKGGGSAVVNSVFDFSTLSDGTYYMYLYSYFLNSYIPDSEGENAYDAQLCFKVDAAGVGEVAIEELLTVGYNKTSGCVEAKAESGVDSVAIYSIAGKKCVSQEGNGASIVSADISALPSGVYVVKAVAGNGKTVTKKIVK